MQCDDDFYCIFYSCMQKEYQILHYEPNTTLLNISSQAQSYSIVHPDFSIIVCVESVEMYRRLLPSCFYSNTYSIIIIKCYF